MTKQNNTLNVRNFKTF